MLLLAPLRAILPAIGSRFDALIPARGPLRVERLHKYLYNELEDELPINRMSYIRKNGTY